MELPSCRSSVTVAAALPASARDKWHVMTNAEHSIQIPSTAPSFRGARLINLIRTPVRYVGRDLEDPRRTKRTVQYKEPEDVWNYIGGGKRLPAQWNMWLSHTRKHPPTLEELQQDLERQRQVLANAALIEARDLEERQERLRIEQSLKAENAKRTRIEQPQIPSQQSPTPDHDAPESRKAAPKQDSSPTADEPESWSPQTLRRRG
ncbi:hypothetical protein AN958_00513 [Leucoagaricus sp. SymC.cos]|nr:hypothetical protein AN958_00513 [Leucoagaricus sp. SymC.cos]